jgi:hypothetical protein
MGIRVWADYQKLGSIPDASSFIFAITNHPCAT